MAEVSKGLTGRIESLSPGGLWVAGVAAAAGAVMAAAVAGALALSGSGLWVGWRPVLLAVGVAVLAPAAGLAPVGLCNSEDSKRISKAAYSGTPIRMVTALILGLPVVLRLGDKSDRVAFGLWLAGLYLVSLMVETVLLAVWLRGRRGSTRV